MREILGAWTRGPDGFEAERARLEEAYAAANGGGSAVLVPSGRDAFRFLLEAIARPGQRRVVLPAYADRSLLEVVTSLGLEPVACDVRRLDGAIDPQRIDALLGPDVVALTVIHLFGRPAPIEAIGAIAARHGVALIEDCAHAPIAPFAVPAVRSLVTASFTSLAPFKLIDCGGGGIAHSADAALAAAVRKAAQRSAPAGGLTSLTRLLGATALETATTPAIYNAIGHRAFVRLSAGGGAIPFYKRHIRPFLKRGADGADPAAPRPPSVPSAPFLRAGLRQLASLPGRLAERRRLARVLAEGLPAGLLFAAEVLAESAEYAQIAVVSDRDAALRRLAAAGVDALPSPMIAWGEAAGCPVAAALGENAIQLPWFDGITDADVRLMRDALRRLAGSR